jgi:hypothetical protein
MAAMFAAEVSRHGRRLPGSGAASLERSRLLKVGKGRTDCFPSHPPEQGPDLTRDRDYSTSSLKSEMAALHSENSRKSTFVSWACIWDILSRGGSLRRAQLLCLALITNIQKIQSNVLDLIL